jgi:hypothetical protein
MNDDVSIRLATEDEVDDVMQLAMLAAEENGFLDANAVLLLETVYPSLQMNRGLCGVIGEPGKLEAFVVLRIGTMYYSPQLCVEEKVVYVHPDFRAAKGGRARKLCEFSKHVADTLNLPLLIGICSSSRTQAKVKLYERIFGPPAGAYWLYRTQTGGHTVT